MVSVASIAYSGMQAAQLRLNASAGNVANISTPDYRRQVVNQQEAPGGAGVRATMERESSVQGTALEKEAVDQMSAAYAFQAGLKTIKVQDQMMGALLSVKA